MQIVMGHVPFDVFHHIRPQNDTLGLYLSERHWQMRHIRLHGCNNINNNNNNNNNNKAKNCLKDDTFISYNDRIEKMLHNKCTFAMAISLR